MLRPQHAFRVMPWRLPAPVRSLIVPGSQRYSSSKVVGPLRILFCGSDEFSIASLRALHQAQTEDERLIQSIEVVHRPAKRTGRGLKVVKEALIKRVAIASQLPTHDIDTFTGWTPPNPFDIIIAVSFGLFVPPRILNNARYGGLNVHPSLLPDLRGPAPIHHTLLRRPHAGVTIQTLHPKMFDHGTILSQSPPYPLAVAPEMQETNAEYRDFRIPEPITIPHKNGVENLTTTLGQIGGSMLVDVLKTRAFIPPLHETGWYASSSGPVDHAGKINKSHSYVDFVTDSSKEILTRHSVLGDLWSTLPKGRRFVINEVQAVEEMDVPDQPIGLFASNDSKGLFVRTKDEQLLQIETTVAGGRKGHGNAHIRQILRQMKSQKQKDEM